MPQRFSAIKQKKCRHTRACCLIEKDTEADAYGAEYQFHCLIIEDTVANVRRNE
jgi:hypothetical protein